MAQSKSFFGLRKGSTKSLTFSVYNGKQVTKDRVTQVKNPRTSMQMKQRAIMATAIRAYSAMKEICDHSNESLSYGQKTMNWFIRENAKLLRSLAPNVNLALAKGNAVINSYIVSKGSLSAPVFMYDDQFEGAETHFYFYRYFANGIINAQGQQVDTTTVGQMLSLLGAPNVGDMVTFLLIQNSDTSQSSDSPFYWIRFKHTAENTAKEFKPEGQKDLVNGFTEGVDFETNIDNFSSDDFKISVWTLGGTNGKYDVYFTIGSSDEFKNIPAALGVITSRKTDAGWLRSTSRLVYNDYAVNYDAALASYPTNEEKILNGGNV